MRFKDPADVDCPSCRQQQHAFVADLLSENAACTHCGASLAEIGRRMHQSLDEWEALLLVVDALLDLKRELSVPIVLEDEKIKGIRTKADYVSTLVDHLQQRLPSKCDPTQIGALFDRSAGSSVSLPDSTSIDALLGATRFAERINAYRRAH